MGNVVKLHPEPEMPRVTFEQVGQALGRLVEIARSDTGQSRRVADFLLAWWNGDDNGDFPILHLCNVDAAISTDMLTIFLYLAAGHTAYADQWGYKTAMEELWELWRSPVAKR